MSLTARVHDNRFARTDVHFELPGKEVAVALGPARIIEGRVLKGDTRQPAAGIVVRIFSRGNTAAYLPALAVRSDKDGRFRVNHYAADSYHVRTDETPGQPYFAINILDFNWPRGPQVKHNLEVVLPRGILQNGMVMDDAGKPVAGAQVLYLPQLYNNPTLKGQDPDELWVRQIGRAKSAKDGSFQIPVLPGPGHLCVVSHDSNYIMQVRVRKEIFGHDRLGGFWTANGFVKLDIKPDVSPAGVRMVLKRAREFHGRVVDAEGKPVAAGHFAVRSLDADLHRESGIAEEREGRGVHLGPTIAVKEGRFDLPHCDPMATYRVFIVDEANKRGAISMLEGDRPDDKPLRVDWQPCGSASLRCVDSEGNPVGNHPVVLWIAENLRQGSKEAGTMRTAAPFNDVIVADKDGKAIFDNLIPGVRYLLLEPDGAQLKEFTVEPGKKRDLGALGVDPKK
jgi:hypothetical protein